MAESLNSQSLPQWLLPPSRPYLLGLPKNDPSWGPSIRVLLCVHCPLCGHTLPFLFPSPPHPSLGLTGTQCLPAQACQLALTPALSCSLPVFLLVTSGSIIPALGSSYGLPSTMESLHRQLPETPPANIQTPAASCHRCQGRSPASCRPPSSSLASLSSLLQRRCQREGFPSRGSISPLSKAFTVQ